MAQFMRPTADITRATRSHEQQSKDSNGALEVIVLTQPGREPTFSTGASAFEVINETLPDDADYFESGGDAFGEVIAVETGNPTAPVSDRNHFLRFRTSKNSSGGEVLSCSVELRQGYTAETRAGIGTFIAGISVEAVPDNATTYRYRLTVTEAALITDYTDLQFRFLMNRVGGAGGDRRTRIYWAEFEVPSLGDDTNEDFKLTSAERQREEEGLAIGGVVESGLFSA